MRQPNPATWPQSYHAARQIDPRIKLVLLLVFLISLALLKQASARPLAFSLILLLASARLARLPVFRLLRASLLVVPVVGVFAVLVYLAGDPRRATLILIKTYLSAFSVLITISCTSLPLLFWAARCLGFPPLLLEVTQLIYRYLFVLAAETRVMQTAFVSRNGRPGWTALRASSGMIAVLFGRSYRKAATIYHAMAARGYSGVLFHSRFEHFTARDLATLLIGSFLAVAVHWV